MHIYINILDVLDFIILYSIYIYIYLYYIILICILYYVYAKDYFIMYIL